MEGHGINLFNRNTGTITGVKDCVSFDLKTILLETECGMLLIKGQDLHVNKHLVEKGEVDISGTIDSLSYSEIANYAKKNESFISRIFK